MSTIERRRHLAYDNVDSDNATDTSCVSRYIMVLESKVLCTRALASSTSLQQGQSEA